MDIQIWELLPKWYLWQLSSDPTLNLCTTKHVYIYLLFISIYICLPSSLKCTCKKVCTQTDSLRPLMLSIPRTAMALLSRAWAHTHTHTYTNSQIYQSKDTLLMPKTILKCAEAVKSNNFSWFGQHKFQEEHFFPLRTRVSDCVFFNWTNTVCVIALWKCFTNRSNS